MTTLYQKAKKAYAEELAEQQRRSKQELQYECSSIAEDLINMMVDRSFPVELKISHEAYTVLKKRFPYMDQTPERKALLAELANYGVPEKSVDVWQRGAFYNITVFF